ncbi:hypothetical protein Q9R32_08705 [Actinotalea sp. AC32]|nr:hypothetical protein [Actinotalea sp. AC32]
MTGLSLLGPWPGGEVLSAQTTVLDRLAAAPTGVEPLPSLVQLPERGPWAESTGRTASLLTGMPVELGPHGWKLCDRPGRDLEHAQALLREDVDALAVAAHGWTGPLVVSVRGPWTLAAVLYLARGDRVLADAGAVRELVASLAEGVATLVDRVRAAVPGAEPVVVLREAGLPDVLGGTVATFSGRGRIPAADADVVVAGLRGVVDGARAAGAQRVVVHTGGRFAARSVRAAAASGADALGLALGPVRGPQWELLAEVVEQGTGLWFALPREQHGRRDDPAAVARSLSGPWSAVGLPASGLADVVVHVETSGTVAGGDVVLVRPQAAKHAIGTAARVAEELASRAAGG